MIKFGLYLKNANESAGHVNIIDMPTKTQAEAYFAGVKQLSLQQLTDLFDIREINKSSKGILYGNR
tara:strand:- start:102 stop:299 length:198 start_codon:yes stop_codon:yes gene_type:complete